MSRRTDGRAGADRRTGQPIPQVGDLRVKDVNGEGQLEPYEDWRLSGAERAADPAQRVPPYPRVGLR